MQPTFKIGDMAVYRKHGVAVIKSIEPVELYGSPQNVYVLEVLDSKRPMPERLRIPVEKVNSVGLRRLISEEEVEEVYDILRERPTKFDQQTWNRRQRKYKEKLNTGSIYDLGEIIRDLFLLRFTKPLSYGEKLMLDEAQELLVRELSIVLAQDKGEVEAAIEAIFADAAPPPPPEPAPEPEPDPEPAPRTARNPKSRTTTSRSRAS
jgi:CarD family transcriptional regulator